MSRELRERVLIITGASSGIGAATAVEAGRAGVRVTLAARRQRRLRQVARRVEEAGGEALVVPTDVADPAQIRRMAERTLERWGRIDALFANAGFGHMHRAERTTDELEEELWTVNYRGVRRSIQAVLPQMRRQGSGHILLCSSLVAVTGLPYYSVYASTKAAMKGLFMSLQLELEPEGIDVTCVYPGSTSTEFHDKVAERCGRDAASEATPRFMVQTSEHVARRVVRCLRRPSPEVWPHRFLHLLSGFWAWFPRFRAMSMRNLAMQGREAVDDVEQRSTRPTPIAAEEPVAAESVVVGSSS
jgi:short-subunit dehydrogenase